MSTERLAGARPWGWGAHSRGQDHIPGVVALRSWERGGTGPTNRTRGVYNQPGGGRSQRKTARSGAGEPVMAALSRRGRAVEEVAFKVTSGRILA